MTVEREPTGATTVSQRVILRAAERALHGSGLVVREVIAQGSVVQLKVEIPDGMAESDGMRVLEDRLGYAFWIDLGLADHTPRFSLIRAGR